MRPDPSSICLNLWAYVDSRTSLVQRVAGRAYVLDGTDEQRFALLTALSRSDYATADIASVPRQFAVVPPIPDIPPIEGAVHADELADPTTMSAVFEPVYRKIEAGMPQQLTFDAEGEPEVWKIAVPDNALFLKTLILEQPDGTLVPQVGTPNV